MTRALLGLVLTCLLLAACAAPAAGAEERHVGYYYPELTSQEVYQSRARMAREAGRNERIGFTVATINRMLSRPYPPPYIIFAKGEDAEKLIIVALDERMATLYRARAVLAQLTAEARATDLFRNLAVDDYYTFFDLARLLGFQEITVSDGLEWAHRIELR